MTARRQRFAAAMLGLGLLSTVLPVGLHGSWQDDPADEKPATKRAAEKNPADGGKEKADDEATAELIRRLNADDFETREQATEDLAKLGMDAIPAVTKAAETEDLEIGVRCITVLRRLMQSTNRGTKEAAREALKKLSESKNQPIARRAKDNLEAGESQPRQPRGFPGGGQVQIQVGGFGGNGGGESITRSEVNGKLHVEVKNGAQTIEIDADNGRDIVVTVTDGTGKDAKTKEYKAADVDELKKNHPQAAELYERYSSNEIGLPGFAGFPFEGMIGPGDAPQPPRFPFGGRGFGRRMRGFGGGFNKDEVLLPLENAEREIDAIAKELETMSQQKLPDPKKLADLAKRLGQARKKLEESKNALP